MSYNTIFCVVVFIVFPCNLAKIHSNRYNLVQWINKNQSLWTACENFDKKVTQDELKRLNGVVGLHPDPEYQLTVKKNNVARNFIPEYFDAREAWPMCSDTIGNVQHQGNCGSCWAFASAGVMTDRLCIETNGNTKFYFSPEDLLECCTDCVTDTSDKCLGGYVGNAWQYWIDRGLVSGGDYLRRMGCKPYSSSAFYSSIAPKCSQKCQPLYNISYIDDKVFGKGVYKVGSPINQIQSEIMTNGPVVAIYEVYEDFYYYGSGVYRHITGSKMGNHAVKIIGWGTTEHGVPYWLVVNSWGNNWAGLGGFFKIVRGSNHCGIEEYVIGGSSSSDVFTPISFIIVTSFVNVFLFQNYYK